MEDYNEAREELELKGLYRRDKYSLSFIIPLLYSYYSDGSASIVGLIVLAWQSECYRGRNTLEPPSLLMRAFNGPLQLLLYPL